MTTRYWPDKLKLPSKGEVEKRLWENLNLRSKPIEPKVIYDELAEYFDLSPKQRLAGPRNDPAWNYRVRQAVRTLVEKGWVEKARADRLWILTEKGRKRKSGPEIGDL